MGCDLWQARLDAYVDGELSAAEMSEADAHLRDCALCAAGAVRRIQRKRAVQLAGRRFSPDARFRQRIQQKVAGRRYVRIWQWAPGLALAAATLLVAFLGFSRWPPSQRGPALGEIVDLHVAALASANPVDVASSDRHTVKPWFAGKLPFTFDLPELAGTPFTLAGGRLAYFEQSPAAMLIYGVRKHHISVFVLQDRPDFQQRFGKRGFVAREASFNIRSWSQGGLRYFGVSDAGSEDLAQLSELLKKAGKP